MTKGDAVQIDVRVIEILMRWEKERLAGQDLSPEDLCIGRPELVEQVRDGIARLGKVATFLERVERGPVAMEVWVKGGSPLPGSRLIEEKPFNEGGSGEVWRAVTPGGFAQVLKRVPLGGSIAEREVEAMKLLPSLSPHPHLLKVYDVQRVGEDLVISMEQADGSLLDELKASPGGVIPVERLLVYVRDAADGLDHLNRQKVRHRDVKPGNLLLFGGRIKVGDYGLAKATDRSVGSHSGAWTPAYAAPEWRLGEVTPSSDQYSLALTYAHLRTGKLPPDLSGLPAAEADAIRRALAEDPARRWESCLAFVNALEAAMRPDNPPPVTPTVAPLVTRDSLLELFGRLNPPSQIDRLIGLLGMPQQHRPSKYLPHAERVDHVLDWAEGEPSGFAGLDARLQQLIAEQQHRP